MVELVRAASCSVALPISPASGKTAKHAAPKIRVSEVWISSSYNVTGTKMSSRLKKFITRSLTLSLLYRPRGEAPDELPRKHDVEDHDRHHRQRQRRQHRVPVVDILPQKNLRAQNYRLSFF